MSIRYSERTAPPPKVVTRIPTKDPVADLAGFLLSRGAARVSVTALEHAFVARNPLFEALERRIGAGGSDG